MTEGQITTLDAIAAGWRDLDRWREENAEALAASGGELPPEVAARFDVLDLAQRDKVDGYYLRQEALKGQIAAKQGMSAQLAKAIAQHERDIEWLRARADLFMHERGVEEVQGNIWAIGYRKHGGPRKLLYKVLSSSPLFPGRFLKDPPPPPAPEPDQKVIREALNVNDPDALAVAELAPQGKSVVIG